jgi:hypothetical protein
MQFLYSLGCIGDKSIPSTLYEVNSALETRLRNKPQFVEMPWLGLVSYECWRGVMRLQHTHLHAPMPGSTTNIQYPLGSLKRQIMERSKNITVVEASFEEDVLQLQAVVLFLVGGKVSSHHSSVKGKSTSSLGNGYARSRSAWWSWSWSRRWVHAYLQQNWGKFCHTGTHSRKCRS